MAEYCVFEFEDIDETLSLVPLSARRALDGAGIKLSLAEWQTLPHLERARLAEAGSSADIQRDLIARALTSLDHEPARIAAVAEPSPQGPPNDVVAALGSERPLTNTVWAALKPLERWVIAKLARGGKPGRLEKAYAALVGYSGVSPHFTPDGAPRMVNVAAKGKTERTAVAEARVRLNSTAFACLVQGNGPKGDVLGTARLAGIMAAKRTSDLIPLCHPLSLSAVQVDCALSPPESLVRITARVSANDRTGVEMEALVAASISALTVYDMLKSVDRAMVIESTRLVSKTGGKSGDYQE